MTAARANDMWFYGAAESNDLLRSKIVVSFQGLGPDLRCCLIISIVTLDPMNDGTNLVTLAQDLTCIIPSTPLQANHNRGRCTYRD